MVGISVAWPSGKAEACKASILSSNLSATFFSWSVSFLLYLVSTPIGHLQDITRRALEVLERVDLILCEDTRRSSILLQKYDIQKPLISFHKFNEAKIQEKILSDLQMGKEVALISDAGTPCINDPGLALVRACIEAKISFTAIPGPCSLIQALVLSGFDSARFQFVGFLPKKGLKDLLKTLLYYPGTSIGFESPERVVKTLSLIEELDPERNVAVVREMTKTFEECLRGKPRELIGHFEKKAPRGEIVILLGKREMSPEDLPLDELMQLLQKLHGLPLKEAIKLAAQLKNMPKSAVYKQAHECH
jgi:16S rRNA (cytidine1402-2'-O)-methyltransferase